MKVVFISSELTSYRLYLFESIAKRLKGKLIVLTRSKDSEEKAIGYRILDSKDMVLKKAGKNPHGYNEDRLMLIPIFLINILFKQNPNIVISLNPGIRSLLSFFYCKFKNIPLILVAPLTEHSEANRSKIQLHLRRFLFNKANAVVTNGKSGANYIKSLGSKHEKIHLIPYSTKNALFMGIAPERTIEARYKLLTVGQLIPRKGLVEFAEVLGNYLNKKPSRTIEWTLVGRGPLRNTLSSLQFHQRLKINVIDHVEYSKLVEIYSNHGIFVFPTLCDEWGVVVNEAMAAAMPVIGSIYSGAVDELIIENKTGWLIDPKGDDINIFTKLDAVFNCNDDVLSKMGNQSRGVINNFDSDKLAEAYINLIDKFNDKATKPNG